MRGTTDTTTDEQRDRDYRNGYMAAWAAWSNRISHDVLGFNCEQVNTITNEKLTELEKQRRSVEQNRSSDA